MTRPRRWLAAAFAAPLLAVVPLASASAHPLGNFTINVYDGLVVEQKNVQVDHVVDMAEIPAFQQRQAIDRNGDGRIDVREASSYAETACAAARTDASLTAAGQAVALSVAASHVTFPSGAAGLTTLRLVCTWVGALGSARSLHWSDGSDNGHVGWHEVTAVGDRTTLLATDVPSDSVSHRLTAYPKDLLRSPLAQHTATLRWRLGGPAYSGGPVADTNPSARPLDAGRAAGWYTNLLSHRNVTAGFALLALVVAVGLGALHALAPGHGKTVMAAYLVGARGTWRHAAGLGLTVTATHTAGVLALGLTISAASAWAPEHLYPWLSLTSGVLVVATGLSLLRRRGRPVTHAHHHHEHEHDGHGHEHPTKADDRPLPSRRAVALLGLAGGMVPSPSAVVVLLGALALHRVLLGVALVVAYGLGMAATLCLLGVVLAASLRRVQRGSSRLATVRRWLPGPGVLRRAAGAGIVSAAGVTIAGLVLVTRSALQL